MGLTGLILPKSAEMLARAAHAHNIPFVLSMFATAALEDIARLAREHAWFQLCVPNDSSVTQDLLQRAQAAGYRTLVVTIDVPTRTRRHRDIRNGLSVPPRTDLRTLLQILRRPGWALLTLRNGLPEFKNLTAYLPTGLSLSEVGIRIDALFEGHVSTERVKAIRNRWSGKLIVKGVLDPVDALACKGIGVDAVVVSNHGGRQLDAAPSPVEVLSDIKRAVGTSMPVLMDGGIRSGLDIARALAAGADFVLLGRAFMFAVAALGAEGCNHVISLLAEELRSTLGQVGCPRPSALGDFLAKAKVASQSTV